MNASAKQEAATREAPEKRRGSRTHYPCKLEVDIPAWGQCRAVCQDISDSGVYISLDSKLVQPIAIGATVAVRVVTGLPQTKTLNTQVVRADKQGLGLKFIA